MPTDIKNFIPKSKKGILSNSSGEASLKQLSASLCRPETDEVGLDTLGQLIFHVRCSSREIKSISDIPRSFVASSKKSGYITHGRSGTVQREADNTFKCAQFCAIV